MNQSREKDFHSNNEYFNFNHRTKLETINKEANKYGINISSNSMADLYKFDIVQKIVEPPAERILTHRCSSKSDAVKILNILLAKARDKKNNNPL